MTLPRIIGITGYARHGKDTIASVLSRELGYNRVALADQMKALMLVLDPILHGSAFDSEEPLRLSSVVEAGGWEEAKTDPEVRRLLQVFGTEVGREGLGENVWIEALVRNTKGFYPPSDRKIVIPDIRFLNEAEWVRRVGELWRVTRYDIIPDEAQGARQVPFNNGLGVSHASERDIGALLVDQEFTNDGTKAAFQDKILRYLKNRLALVDEVGQSIAAAREQYRPALDKLADR